MYTQTLAKPRRYLVTSIVAAMGVVSPLALSQEQTSERFAIEEIVVTAQKREQSLQDVSIAVSAFTGDQLQSLDAVNLQALTEHIAGAELFDDRGSGQPTWIIRGVGLADYNANNTPTAAIYYDEYYLTSNVLGGIGMFDIDRVEVLKGPQGGLYGRNTSGGAVRVISSAPAVGEDYNGYVSASYGRWGSYSLEGAVGGSLSDQAAFRLAAVTNQSGGWQDSLATPNDEEHGDKDFNALRAQLALQPAKDVELLLKVEFGSDNSETTLGMGQAIWEPGVLDANWFPVPCAAALAGQANGAGCTTLANLTASLGPLWDFSADPGIGVSLQDSDGTEVLSSPINQLDNQWRGFTGRLDWDLSFATLTAIGGYLDYENNQVFDFDGSPLRLFHEDTRSDLESWSQEVRLVSNGEGPLTWLAGLMYAEDEIDEVRFSDLLDNFIIFPSSGWRSFNQETESWAVYGQLEYQLADNWRVNGSLRYTDEEKQLNDYSAFDNDDYGLDLNGDGDPGAFFWVENVQETYKLDAHLSGHIGLDWTPTNDLLVYGKITRGFKSGGFFGGYALSEEELSNYDEEIVWSYELGFKTDWRDGSLRVNGAVYYYDYQDVQGFTQVLSEATGTALFKLGNMGDAEHKGAELEMIWYPRTLEGLSLQASAAWIDAEFTDSGTIIFDPVGVAGNLEGLTRAFAPELSTSLQVRYETPLTPELLAAVQLNYSWRDDLAGTDSFHSTLDYAAYGHESYDVLNARVSLMPKNDSWSLALSGHNLMDEDYVARSTGDALGSFIDIPAQPRSWTLELGYKW